MCERLTSSYSDSSCCCSSEYEYAPHKGKSGSQKYQYESSGFKAAIISEIKSRKKKEKETLLKKRLVE
jgi:hypothetical protein